MDNSSFPLGVGLTPLATRREVVLHVASRAEQLGYAAFYLAEGWGHDAAGLLAEVAVCAPAGSVSAAAC